ncbi:MAG: leader peptidase (prepilin peptidase)/N-methyltransferase [Myxococcota bacterium]|jgi:leader peptidase (prepilin peptidase)/N-methyltransferase
MSWLEVLQSEPWLYNTFILVLGAMAGSFASAAIYRIPEDGLSIVRPARSFCPQCKHTLKWYDNIPVLGYLLLRGKCRYCHAPFSFGYLWHEVACAGLFYLVAHSWIADSAAGGGAIPLLLAFIAVSALWIAAVIDWKHFILPDGITIGGVGFGFLAAVIAPQFQFWPNLSSSLTISSIFGLEITANISGALISAFLSSSISFILLLGIGRGFSYLLGQEALGFGDVKYIAAVGAFLGIEGSLWTLAIGVFAGALLGILNVLRFWIVVSLRRKQRGSQLPYVHSSSYVGWRVGRVIPFGPPLILGTILTMLFPLQVHNFFLVTWPSLLVNG